MVFKEQIPEKSNGSSEDVQMRKQNKLIDFFSRNFDDAWDYFLESKKYFYVVFALFSFAFITGFVFASKLGFLDEVILSILNKTSELNWYEMIIFIFQNNVQASFFGFLMGILLGIPSIIVLFTNGLLIGYVVNKVAASQGLLPLWTLLPHGIFEIPAVFISLGLGLKLGFFVFERNKIKAFKRRFYSGLKVFLFIVVPLLLIAAIIEGLLIVLIK